MEQFHWVKSHRGHDPFIRVIAVLLWSAICFTIPAVAFVLVLACGGTGTGTYHPHQNPGAGGTP